MTTKNKKKDIQYGNFELPDDELIGKNVKVRITTLIDKDILDSLRAYAKKKGVKYQTALNALLRSFFENSFERKKGHSTLSEAKVRRIVREELKKCA